MISRRVTRRAFVQSAAGLVPLVVAPDGWHTGTFLRGAITSMDTELSADLVIIGGGLGGCAAALAATRHQLRVIMTEETDWIGGQLTQQGVPPDENRWIETIGGTRSYQALRTGIRDFCRRNLPLTEHAKANALLNPGNGWVSRLCAEPRVALAVLQELLVPYMMSGQLRILLNHRATGSDVVGDRVRAVRVQDREGGRGTVLRAPYFADATELGDLLPLTGTEYVTGAESQAQTGEPHAKSAPEPDNVQGFTMCLAMDHWRGEDHVIDRPRDYAFWRDLTLPSESGTPYHLISFDDADSKRIGFDPEARRGFWTYRRIIDGDQFRPGMFARDVTMVNWAQNDYSFGSLCDGSAAEQARHIDRAKQQSLSLLYWLQTEAPRPDGGIGWKGLRLRPDIVGTTDGLTKYPYIRESRRIQAEFTVLEQHVSAEIRARDTGVSPVEARAEVFQDSVGIGHYNMDLHLTTRGDRGRYGATAPFQIPLGALIPLRMENLLPACKNLGVTHLTNGCYRLHPVEWTVGESVGALVAFCKARNVPPRAVRNSATLLSAYQAMLVDDGVRLAWPAVLPG
jgi:hypothetical protein